VPEAERADMSATSALVDGVLQDAKAVGAVGLDVTAALRGAQPGAFLDKDLHMSGKGHAAVAKALVPALDELPPLAKPRAGLPEGRTLPPTDSEWALVTELDVKGSTAAACETKQVREWLRVSCHKTDALTPVGVVVEKGGLVDTSVLAAGESAVLLSAFAQNEEPLEVRFLWRDHSRVLKASRTTNGTVTAAFGEREAKRALSLEQQADRSIAKGLCRTFYDDDDGKNVLNCDLMNGFIGSFDGSRSAVSLARPVSAATCADDEAQAGAFTMCSKLCDAKRPCADARAQCMPWMGASVCRAPAGTAYTVTRASETQPP
jgi:hypothetical protein